MITLPGAPASVTNATASRARVRPRGLPVPPEPVMPPEGVGPVTDPTANVGGDELSPTTLVLNYLKQRGYQPTSENVRRALEANARDPGVIPGLRSGTASTDAEDRAAMGVARPRQPYQGTGTGGPGDQTPIVSGDPRTSAAPDTSAPPPGGGSSNLGNLILGIGGAGAGAGALYGAERYLSGRGGTPTPGGSVAPPVDPAAGVPGTEAAPRVAPPPEAQVTPLDTALNRAVPTDAPIPPQVVGDLNPIARPGSLDMTPPRGPVSSVAGSDAPVVPFNSESPRGAPPPRDVADLQAQIAAQRQRVVAPRTSTTLRGPGTTAQELLDAAARVGGRR